MGGSSFKPSSSSASSALSFLDHNLFTATTASEVEEYLARGDDPEEEREFGKVEETKQWVETIFKDLCRVRTQENEGKKSLRSTPRMSSLFLILIDDGLLTRCCI